MSNENYNLIEPFITVNSNKNGMTIPTNILKDSSQKTKINNIPIPTSTPNQYQQLDKNVIVKLVQTYYPIVYFHKDEPYMPIDYDDLLNISNFCLLDKPYGNAKKVKDLPTKSLEEKKQLLLYKKGSSILVNIDGSKKYNNPIAKQLIVRTSGFFYAPDHPKGNVVMIELLFFYIFSWNGTIEWHPFDIEKIIVRLMSFDGGVTWKPVKVFGSAHGNGRWFTTWNNHVEFEGTHPVMFSGIQSHTMYAKPHTYKRIFLFGNDTTAKNIRYEPSEFILIYKTSEAYSITKDTKQLVSTSKYNYFINNSFVGQYQVNIQQWAGHDILLVFYYDSLRILDEYYKFQGGIDGIFTGDDAVVKKPVKLAIKIVSIIIWSLFLIFLIYYTLKIYNDKKIIFRTLFVLRNLLAYIFLSFMTFFMFLFIFIINDY